MVLGKDHLEKGFGKGYISKGYACKKCSAQKPVGQVSDMRSGANMSKQMANNNNNNNKNKNTNKNKAKTTKKNKQQKRKHHPNDSKTCKTKPVLSEAWAELSPAQGTED